MVTAVVVSIGEVLAGKTGASPAAAGARANNSGNAVNGAEASTDFALLLEGQLTDGMSAQETIAVPALNAVAGQVKSQATQSDEKSDTATDPTEVSAELLALCGIPVVTPIQQPAPVANVSVSAAGSTPEVAIGTVVSAGAALVANTKTNETVAPATPPATASTADTAVDIATTAAIAAPPAPVVSTATNEAQPTAAPVSDFDMQWLRSNAVAAQSTGVVAKADKAPPVLNAKQDAAAIDLSKLLTSDTGADAQIAAQNALMPTTPLMSAFNDQLRTTQKDPALDAAQLAVVPSASTTSGAVTTQLSDDASALDGVSRHQIHSAVGSHQWATELGNKLTVMASKDTQSATLYMTPADLGPVQVRIDMNKDQASVWFTAEHAETRSALEQSLPKLREMFTAQGMSLTDAGVFGDRQRQQFSNENTPANFFAGAAWSGDDSLADTSMVRSISLGLLDAYA